MNYVNAKVVSIACHPLSVGLKPKLVAPLPYALHPDGVRQIWRLSVIWVFAIWATAPQDSRPRDRILLRTTWKVILREDLKAPTPLKLESSESVLRLASSEQPRSRFGLTESWEKP